MKRKHRRAVRPRKKLVYVTLVTLRMDRIAIPGEESIRARFVSLRFQFHSMGLAPGPGKI
jgi:hypothetical protein